MFENLIDEDVEYVVNICEFIRRADITKVLTFAHQFVEHEQHRKAYPLIMEQLGKRLNWNY